MSAILRNHIVYLCIIQYCRLKIIWFLPKTNLAQVHLHHRWSRYHFCNKFRSKMQLYVTIAYLFCKWFIPGLFTDTLITPPIQTPPASVAQLDAPSDWRPGGRGFNPRRGRQHSFVEIDHEIFSTVILSLPLIQEGQLSVSGERMCTILVNRLED